MDTEDEKRRLLHNHPPDKQTREGVKRLSVNSIKEVTLLCLVIYLMVQPGGILSYIINEWTQFTVKKEYFINTTISTSTDSCKTSNHSSGVYRNLTKVQEVSAKWLMLNSLAETIPGFFTCLVLSPLTDTYGRRFLIILTLFGVFSKYAAACVIIYTDQHFWYMVAANGLEGITGTSLALFSVSFSYIADLVKDKKQRVFCIVIVEFMLMASVMVSGLLSGILINKFGFMIPAVICTAILLVSVMVAILFLPESLKSEKRIKPMSVTDSLMRPFLFYTSKAFKGKRLLYALFLLAFGFAELVGQNRSSLETLYLLGMPFCFSPTFVGYFGCARHFGEAVIGLGSVKFMQVYISNEAIAILGTVSSMVSYIVEALARSELMIFMGK